MDWIREVLEVCALVYLLRRSRQRPGPPVEVSPETAPHPRSKVVRVRPRALPVVLVGMGLAQLVLWPYQLSAQVSTQPRVPNNCTDVQVLGGQADGTGVECQADNIDGGAASTAGSLAANGANCGAGQWAAGVDASGAAEGCTADAIGVTDHGALTGLSDDDHTQYLLANGTRSTTGNFSIGSGFDLRAVSTQLNVSPGGTSRFSFWTWESTPIFSGTGTNAATMRSASSTATVPGLMPSWGDLNTGIGWAGSDQLSHIAGGAEGLRVDSSATATHTRFLVYDVDNATLERVTVGAADSCGSGFKCLRIPN